MPTGRAIRVLCVSPRFAPSNAADSHRLRLIAPHLRDCNVEIEVLAVDPEDVREPVDHELTNRLPENLPIHRVRAWPLSGWGLNGLAQRSFGPLHRKGGELLRHGKFDLVFFSTTEFLLHVLGPMWRKRFGVPFCMDFQDPWVNDYYRLNPHIVPPGGRGKHAVSHALHGAAEKSVVKRCAGFLAVSGKYLEQLDDRYGPSVRSQPRLVASFPGEPAEFASLPASARPTGTRQSRTWRYIGRGGPDMAFAAAAFFSAWQRAIEAGLLPRGAARFEAIGTSYVAGDSARKTIQPLAAEAGLEGEVDEHPQRLGYGDMLRTLQQSDALVVFGSDDPAYTASKIYPYLLAGRPLLAIFHEESSVVPLIRTAGGAICVTFKANDAREKIASAIFEAWFETGAFDRAVPLDARAFEPYTARSQAVKIGEWFRRILADGST
jgi:hypothetical protein